MKEALKKKLGSGIAILILAMIIFGILAIIALFGGAIMHLFGFEYESVGSVILFFIISTIVSAPIGIFAKALPNVLYRDMKKLSLNGARFLYAILDTIATSLGLAIVDYFMQSVSASDKAIFIISLVFAVLSIKEIKEIA